MADRSTRLAMGRRLLLFAAFVATVYCANWALAKFGTVPVAPHLEAPAGVFFAGLAFGLRDLLHQSSGEHAHRWVLAAIGCGAALSLVIEDHVTLDGGLVPLAVASAVAFTISELTDLAVYERITDQRFRIVASNTAGAAVDSAVFLWLAFGSQAFFWGQFVGKTLMVLPVLAFVEARHRRRVAPA